MKKLILLFIVFVSFFITNAQQTVWSNSCACYINFQPPDSATIYAILNTKITSSSNVATATKFAATKNINGVAFDGSADITVTAAANTLTGSTLATGTSFGKKFAVTFICLDGTTWMEVARTIAQ